MGSCSDYGPADVVGLATFGAERRANWVRLGTMPSSWKPDRRATPITSCRPFIENTRAVLIHRPRWISVYRTNPKKPHLGVHYLCGNGTIGDKNIIFLDRPPANKLVCHNCERIALAGGLPSSDEIAGHHVHLGKVVAVRTCHKE